MTPSGQAGYKKEMRLLYLVGFLTVLASCSEPTAPIHDLDAIQVSVRVQPTTLVVGTAASIVLTLKNTSIRPVEISACPIYFWVQGSDGEIVGGSNLILCLAGSLVYQPLLFRPFETKRFSLTWSAVETQNVPAGLYDVYGWVNDASHRSTAAHITVQTVN